MEDTLVPEEVQQCHFGIWLVHSDLSKKICDQHVNPPERSAITDQEHQLTSCFRLLCGPPDFTTHLPPVYKKQDSSFSSIHA